MTSSCVSRYPVDGQARARLSDERSEGGSWWSCIRKKISMFIQSTSIHSSGVIVQLFFVDTQLNLNRGFFQKYFRLSRVNDYVWLVYGQKELEHEMNPCTVWPVSPHFCHLLKHAQLGITFSCCSCVTVCIVRRVKQHKQPDTGWFVVCLWLTHLARVPLWCWPRPRGRSWWFWPARGSSRSPLLSGLAPLTSVASCPECPQSPLY